MLRYLSLVLVVAVFAQEPSVTLPSGLERVLRDYEKAWTARDAVGLAALFAPDGFVLSPGQPMVRGRAAIEAHYAKHGGGPLALRAVAFSTDGRTGYIIGAYAQKAGEPDIGKFTLALRRSGRRWLIFSDMDNGNKR